MAYQTGRSLVSVTAGLPARPMASGLPDFDLVERDTRLANRSEVERRLPDIIGRALARAWIDPGFRQAFLADPKGTLSSFRVHLPTSILIDVTGEDGKRPMVVVSETAETKPRRLLYLQLVLVAGR